MKISFNNKGQSLIGIIVVLVVVGLITGGLYYYFSKQIPEVPEIPERPAEEETVKPEEELPKGEAVPEEKAEERPAAQKCTDGTLYDQCSSNKPKHCENGNLVDRCSTCGCPSNSYCINNTCLQDNIETVKKDIVGSYIGGVASDNPNDYLGNHIHGLPDTDWRTYQPLINKVNELTSGLSSNYEKAKAIATWVTNSKKAGNYNIYGKNSSIIGLFYAEAGACTEAAILTTAMLRIAGIPARVVVCPTKIHAYTEAYINGKWIGIDSTFGIATPLFYDDGIFPSPNSILHVRNWVGFPNEKTIIVKEQHPSSARAEYIVATSMSEPVFIKKDTLYLKRSSQFGPPTGEIKRTEWAKINYIRPYFISGNTYIDRIVVETRDIECDAYHCVENSYYDKFTIILSETIYIFGKKYLYNEDGTLYVNYPTEEGGFNLPQLFPYHVSATLPPGEYKFIYQAGGGDFAYVNIDLSPGEEFTINPNVLIKSSNINQQDFDAFIRYLK